MLYHKMAEYNDSEDKIWYTFFPKSDEAYIFAIQDLLEKHNLSEKFEIRYSLTPESDVLSWVEASPLSDGKPIFTLHKQVLSEEIVSNLKALDKQSLLKRLSNNLFASGDSYDESTQ